MIHNFYELTKISDVRKKIQSDILDSFRIDRDSIKKDLFYIEENNNNKKIIHLIYAAENSEAGNFYNTYTIDLIHKYVLR